MSAKTKTAKNTKKAAKPSTRKRKTTSPKKKVAAPKKGRASQPKSKTNKKEEAEVTLDRRRQEDRRQASGIDAVAPKLERREKVQRRRQIDPTTCERDYSDAEVEFMNAMDDYKRKNGRMFPTCSEVLEVICDLGYTKLTPLELATMRPEAAATDEPKDEAFSAEENFDELETVGAEGVVF